MIDFLIDNPSLVQGTLYVLAILIGAAVVAVAAPVIERFLNPSISE